MGPATEPHTSARRISPRLRILFAIIAAGTVALGLYGRFRVAIPIDAVVEGYAYTAVGLAIWALRPENRIGKVLVAYAPLIWSFHFAKLDIPLLSTLTPLMFTTAAFAIPIYAMLAFPRGRLSGPLEKGSFLLIAGNCVYQGIVMMLFFDPRLMGACGSPPCEQTNLLLVHGDPDIFIGMAHANPWWLTAGMVPAAILLVVRLVRATPPARRVLWPMIVPSVGLILANRIPGLTVVIIEVYLHHKTLGFTSDLLDTMSTINQVAVIVLPFTFLIGLWLLRGRRTRVGDLVVELGKSRSPEGLRASLARTLGDPSLEVGFAAGGRYVTAEGVPLELPDETDPFRATTRLEREGEPLAVIVHDRALLEDPRMLDATTAAAGLAVENERLAAEVRAQLAEVRASRQRIVEASDAERRKVERDLHDGAQQRLVSLAMDIRAGLARAERTGDAEMAALLRESANDLDRAITELRELARGLHPQVLADEGLGMALLDLAERSPVPVTVRATEARHPPAVEATAYFLVAEALTNVARYSGASEAVVAVSSTEDSLRVEVSDDGIGGADPSRGSGLRGLADRVEALGGDLFVNSSPGKGTRVVAEIPLATSPRTSDASISR